MTMKPSRYDAIQPFARRAGQIRMFDCLLHEVLPNALLGQVRVLNVREGVLVLAVAHAALATQIRFQSPQWLSPLNAKAQRIAGLPAITSIEPRIVTLPKQTPAPKIQRTLAASTRHVLQDMALHEEHEPLARVLGRLAKLGEKPKNPGTRQ